MANFIVEFPLKTEKYQEDILNKRFEIGRKIYNSLVNITQKRYKEMIKTKKYRKLISSLTDLIKLSGVLLTKNLIIYSFQFLSLINYTYIIVLF